MVNPGKHKQPAAAATPGYSGASPQELPALPRTSPALSRTWGTRAPAHLAHTGRSSRKPLPYFNSSTVLTAPTEATGAQRSRGCCVGCFPTHSTARSQPDTMSGQPTNQLFINTDSPLLLLEKKEKPLSYLTFQHTDSYFYFLLQQFTPMTQLGVAEIHELIIK